MDKVDQETITGFAMSWVEVNKDIKSQVTNEQVYIETLVKVIQNTTVETSPLFIRIMRDYRRFVQARYNF